MAAEINVEKTISGLENLLVVRRKELQKEQSKDCPDFGRMVRLRKVIRNLTDTINSHYYYKSR